MEQLELASDVKDSSEYYEWPREDVVALVPPAARSILSVGCGSGHAEHLLQLQGKAVLGVEMNSAAAQLARSRGLDVIECDAATVRPQLEGRVFDCLIYADVLEHTGHPEVILEEHTELLKPGGMVIISIPNFRHYSVLWGLAVRGEFRYSDSGIFDRTHLRITTSRSTVRWLEDLGMRVSRIEYNIFRRRHRLLSMLTFGIFKEILAYQILVAATRVKE